MTKALPPAKVSQMLVRLRREAKDQGLTAYALAKRTGLGISTVQRLLDGRVSPSLATLEAVTAALGLVLEIRES